MGGGGRAGGVIVGFYSIRNLHLYRAFLPVMEGVTWYK